MAKAFLTRESKGHVWHGMVREFSDCKITNSTIEDNEKPRLPGAFALQAQALRTAPGEAFEMTFSCMFTSFPGIRLGRSGFDPVLAWSGD